MLHLEVDIFNQFKKLNEDKLNVENKDIAKQISVQVVDLWKDMRNLPTEGFREE